MAKRRAKGEGTIYFWDEKKLWVGQIYLPNGKRKVKYSKTQKVIQEWLLTQRNAIKQGAWVSDDSLTISQFIDRYYTDVASHNLRPKTLEVYETLIRLHIKPEIGDIRLSQLRPDHLQKLYSDKLNAGLSRRTVQFIHSILHKALDQALKWGLVNRNVSDLVDAPSPKRKAPETLNVEQVGKLLDTVQNHRWYPVYVLAIYCGFRIGEVLGIHFEDIDLESGIIHVRHAVQTLKGKGIVVTEPKTENSRRPITVPSFALGILRSHMESQKSNQGLIFTTSTGKPVSPRNLVRHFKSALKEAGLPNIRFHDLRHTSATLLLSAGVHPKIVQERLGHSQISLTLDTYSHVIPGLQEEAAEKMDAILGRV